MDLNSLPFNAFDLILAAVLIAGILRGRKHGMSEELMMLLKWLTILLACGLLYAPIGQWLSESTPFSLLACYLMVYITIALVIFAAFALVKHSIGGKLIGSDIFGRAEYYLGMGSGFMRFGCMALVGLALLNARYFSPEEVKAMERYQDDMYGSNFFPGLHTAQTVVFDRSLTGPFIRDYLSFILIQPTKPEKKELHQKEATLP